MYNGILVLNKPQGFTSHDAVAKLRGILRQRKIGHAGTLDPMATGVLVVLLGCATRASGFASGAEKEYIAALRLGLCTDTQDITGQALSICENPPPEEQVRDILPRFLGPQRQVPPMYSAVQIGGRRLYDLARKGQEIDRPEREIAISRLELLPKAAGQKECDHLIRVSCSKGTYVRTLCHDIGAALGCGGCMASLVRVRSGDFTLSQALTLEQVAELHQSGELSSRILPADSVFSGLPKVVLNRDGEARQANGAFLGPCHLLSGSIPEEGALCRVYSSSGAFLMTGRGGELDRGGRAIFTATTFNIKD